MMGDQIVYVALVIVLHCTMEAMHNKICPLQAGLEQLDATDIKVMMIYLESVEDTAHLPAVDQPPAVKSSYMKKIEQYTSQS